MSWREMPRGSVVPKGGTATEYKTGGWRSNRPIHNKETCVHCLTCWICCPDSAIVVKDGKFVEINYDFCKGCGICSKVCPTKPSSIAMKPESEFKK